VAEDRATRGALEGVLRELEVRWLKAVRDRDLETLEKLLAEEFTLTTGRAGAEVRSREEYLSITATSYSITSFRFDELTVNLYGNVAVVRSRYCQEGSMGGERRDTAYRMTDVWIWRDNRWQAVARHASPVA
jgi:ketosteroid isomerase-like protein